MWDKIRSLSQILNKIQQEFSQNPPNDRSDADQAIGQLDQYQKDV